MDFLKNEHFAIPVVCDSVQPSLDHKDSEDSGQNPVISSSDKQKDKEIHLSKSGEVDSSIPKENFPNSVPRREKEEMPSSSPSSKNTVHFDKPNRLVCNICLEMYLSVILIPCETGRASFLVLQVRCMNFYIWYELSTRYMSQKHITE